jgi:hypothetical protein
MLYSNMILGKINRKEVFMDSYLWIVEVVVGFAAVLGMQYGVKKYLILFAADMQSMRMIGAIN